MPAALSSEQKAICADTDSVSSGAMYASIPESNIVAADAPAISTSTPPVLSICDGIRFQPADFKTTSKTLSNANGSGSGKLRMQSFGHQKALRLLLMRLVALVIGFGVV